VKRAAIALAILLSSCAITPDNPAASAEATEPLLCPDKSTCDAYWQRAQAWIAANSAWKIQTASDAIIQTFGPAGARDDLAYLVTRVPNNDGSARIFIGAQCANTIRCYPSKTEAIIAFKRFVRS
jgi:hypothetical protein